MFSTFKRSKKCGKYIIYIIGENEKSENQIQVHKAKIVSATSAELVCTVKIPSACDKNES